MASNKNINNNFAKFSKYSLFSKLKRGGIKLHLLTKNYYTVTVDTCLVSRQICKKRHVSSVTLNFDMIFTVEHEVLVIQLIQIQTSSHRVGTERASSSKNFKESW